ncbi:tetratricopeptide repeat protein [Litorimonas cladophorae]|nr:hypothetical protein [Litorimonas cladophorae]
MVKSPKNFGRAAIFGLCLTPLWSCGDPQTQSPVSPSNEPIWEKTVRQSLETTNFNEDNEFSFSNRQNAYAALEGDGQGLFGLCQEALNDRVPVDWKPFAEDWCVAAAEQSYPDASNFLAESYELGSFGEPNPSKAYEWLERAALDKENFEDLNRRVKGFEELWGGFWETKTGEKSVRRKIESYKPALFEITKRAQGGDTAAMMFVANKYYNGYGVEQSDDAYLYWIIQAAEAGHSRAAWSLGHWFNFADNRQRDRKKALFWYEKSIELGLGSYDPMHTNPIRFVQQLRGEEKIKKNNRLSDGKIKDRLKDVGLKGYLEDDALMCDVALELRDHIVSEFRYCQNLPRYYPKKQLRFNHSLSLRHVKVFAREAFYNDRHAEDWFQTVSSRMKRSAIEGDPDYADALAYECKADLKCIEKWESVAIAGYEKQAAQDNEKAMYNLAAIYSGRYQSQRIGNAYKEVVPPTKDEALSNEWLSKAIHQYQKAADLGEEDAQFNLGFFYENGIGVQKDRKLSHDLFAKFLDQNSPELVSYFHLSGGHSSIFNDLREACRKGGAEIETFKIMTGNVYYPNLEDLECS